jgi:uncharacterized protein YaiL (DUF2058 family)
LRREFSIVNIGFGDNQMGLSIQEQLLKAGMVDKKQVKKVQHEKRVENKNKQKSGESSEKSAQHRLQQQQAEQVRQNQKLNTERNLLAQKKADQSAARQMIQTNKMMLEEGDVSYHYVTADGQIKRISVQQEVADKLAEGKLGLAMYDSEPVLLAAEIVLKVLSRDTSAILAYNDPAELADDYPADW